MLASGRAGFELMSSALLTTRHHHYLLSLHTALSILEIPYAIKKLMKPVLFSSLVYR